jgi:Arc/MetJ family transcription regulator
MESRRTPAKAVRTADELMAEVLRQPTVSEAQQARLAALLAALRRRGPP